MVFNFVDVLSIVYASVLNMSAITLQKSFCSMKTPKASS
jgi:hypothetical protein